MENGKNGSLARLGQAPWRPMREGDVMTAFGRRNGQTFALRSVKLLAPFAATRNTAELQPEQTFSILK